MGLPRFARNDSFALIRRTISAATLLLVSSLLAQENWARHVVISEISPREGYIELYNPTEASQELEGYQIQSMAAHKKSWRTRVKFGKGSRLAPFGYFLVASLRTSLSVKADIAEPFSFGLLPEEGSLRLLDASERQVDLVGWGPRSFSEGSPAPKFETASSYKVLERLPSLYFPQGGNGQDTDDNGKDFLTRKNPEPQSSVSAPEPPAWARLPAAAAREVSLRLKAGGLIERALLDWKEGRFFSAYDKLERAVSLDPGHPSAGKLQSFEADLRAALAAGEISRKHEPLARACLFYLRGDYKMALAALDKATGFSEAGRGRRRIQAVYIPPPPRGVRILSDFPSRLSKSHAPTQKILAPADKLAIIRREPEKAEKFYFEGLNLYARGMAPQAVAAWREAARLDPEDVRVRKALKRVEGR